MDFLTLFQDHFVIVVTLACLLVGYLIKKSSFFKWVPNDDIPVILAVIGVVSNCIVGGLSFESVIYGAFMGVAATGLHQGFKAFVEGNKNNTEGDKNNTEGDI